MAKHRLLQWNRIKVDDIFRQIEEVEAGIIDLYRREVRRGVSKRLT